MKVCSTCGSKYTDRISYCFNDGAVLETQVSASPFGDSAIDAPLPRNFAMQSTGATPPPAPGRVTSRRRRSLVGGGSALNPPPVPGMGMGMGAGAANLAAPPTPTGAGQSASGGQGDQFEGYDFNPEPLTFAPVQGTPRTVAPSVDEVPLDTPQADQPSDDGLDAPPPPSLGGAAPPATEPKAAPPPPKYEPPATPAATPEPAAPEDDFFANRPDPDDLSDEVRREEALAAAGPQRETTEERNKGGGIPLFVILGAGAVVFVIITGALITFGGGAALLMGTSGKGGEPVDGTDGTAIEQPSTDGTADATPDTEEPPAADTEEPPAADTDDTEDPQDTDAADPGGDDTDAADPGGTDTDEPPAADTDEPAAASDGGSSEGTGDAGTGSDGGADAASDGGSEGSGDPWGGQPPAATASEVRITSNPPGATVIIDKQNKGQTPLNIQLDHGLHTVEVSKDGYGEQKKTLDVRADQAVPFELESAARTGNVMIFMTGSKGEKVLVDGKEVGKLPARAQLTEGTHSFRIVGGDTEFTLEREVKFNSAGSAVVNLAAP